LSDLKKRFYGKFRGEVTDNKDPLMQGRIRAKVPGVLGDEETGWALPCSPYGGNGVGFFFVPPVKAKVWIEFEGGDPDYPIWVGCYWGQGETPAMPGIESTKIIKTDTATIKLDDMPGSGGITIETTTGLKIVMDATGIEVTNGVASIKMAQASVSVNNGALEVT
jgi:uncharacterized protein involved in type VI secretion and phage assembly